MALQTFQVLQFSLWIMTSKFYERTLTKFWRGKEGWRGRTLISQPFLEHTLSGAAHSLSIYIPRFYTTLTLKIYTTLKRTDYDYSIRKFTKSTRFQVKSPFPIHIMYSDHTRGRSSSACMQEISQPVWTNVFLAFAIEKWRYIQIQIIRAKSLRCDGPLLLLS